MRVRLTQAEFDEVVERVKGEGLDMSAPSGTIEKMGVKASYAYDGEALTLEILEKPFLVSKAFLEGKLREVLVKQGLGDRG